MRPLGRSRYRAAGVTGSGFIVVAATLSTAAISGESSVDVDSLPSRCSRTEPMWGIGRTADTSLAGVVPSVLAEGPSGGRRVRAVRIEREHAHSLAVVRVQSPGGRPR